MKLSQLMDGIELENRGAADGPITSLTCDTRTLRPGGLFAALQGNKEDGNRFIEEALEKGAAAVLCQRPPEHPGPWLTAPDPRRAYGLLCQNWFGNPGRDMTLIGVTGTNGKTTSTYLLKSVLEQTLHTKVGLVGTNQNLIGETVLPASRTTPDPYELQSILAKMKAAGCTHVVMEVSSHGLAMKRTAGLWFSVGLFTNLTRDHLDFHGTMAAYREAKASLFHQCAAGVFNLDDGAGRQFARTSPCDKIGYGLRRAADVWGRSLRLYPDEVAFTVQTAGGSWPVRVPIPGRFTVYNALGVLACCQALDLPMEEVTAALANTAGVKGRAEVVPVPANFTVVIDYAHTPDALENILTTLRDGTRGRLICLFGCGGDRDRSKRPIMGELAAELADLVILTSDNPRTEDPESILDEIAAGFPAGFSEVIRESDRRKAIRRALELGRSGDTILLTGKGHETTQEISGEKIHFDEREEIAFFFASNTL